MIELAQRSWCPVVRNLEFRIADARTLDLESSFDLAFSNSTLHWVPDHPSVLRGVAAALKPGGHLVFTMGGRGTASVVYRAIGELSCAERWADFLAGALSPHYFFGPEEYSQWLQTAGFEPRRLALAPRPMRHANAAALEGWLRTTWVPYAERIPAAQREEFLRQLTDRVLDSCARADDGVILLPMVNLEVEAEKVVS
jgi:trans-aconitate methyltransferase